MGFERMIRSPSIPSRKPILANRIAALPTAKNPPDCPLPLKLAIRLKPTVTSRD